MSTQNWSILASQNNPAKSAVFYWLFLDEVSPRNFREMGRFFLEFAPESPAKFFFFFREISEALYKWVLRLVCLFSSHNEIKTGLFKTNGTVCLSRWNVRIQWIAETSNQCKGSETACKRTIQPIAKRKQTLWMLFHDSKCHCPIMVFKDTSNCELANS